MESRSSRREFIARSAAGVAGATLLGRPLLAAAAAKDVKKPAWPFYAFDNGLRTVKTIEGKVELLKRLGYAGVELHWGPKELPRWLELLDKHRLRVNAIYTVPTLEAPINADLPQVIKLLKGRPTRIEMAIRSKEFKKPSDPAGDARAVDMLKRVSDLCADTGPVVSIYPHAWFWTEKVSDGTRLAKKTGRKNVGTNFNLVHWHWIKQPQALEVSLREALPHLFSVTINNGEKKGRKIASLDEGDYDVLGFMKLVAKVGYRGQVGLQCYSVKGPSEEHLKRSMGAWREIVAKIGPLPRK